MIKSMTGFGRCEIADEKRKFTVELKSVNHRYLDVNMKMPKKLNFFESAIRSLLKKYIERGKVDLYISYEDYTEDNYALKYNEGLAGEYLKYLNAMAETFHLENDVRVSTLSRYPDVFVMEEQEMDEEELWNGLQKAICGERSSMKSTPASRSSNFSQRSFFKFSPSRIRVSTNCSHAPQIMQEYRSHLTEKIQELLGDTQIDEGRIATEVTIYADKVCVDEETVRLRSHITSMKETLSEGGPVGRKLDFIAQEMNREANTILSKANNIEISDVGINLKTGIEKIREQIQNIE